MDHLILRSLLGEISNLEDRMLRNWRLSSPENERRYQQFAELWRISAAPSTPRASPPRPPLHRIVREAEARRATAVPLRALGRNAPWLRRLAAAAVLLGTGLGLAELRSRRGAADGFGAAELVTSSTERVTVTLTDGTFIRLAPNSRLRMPAKGNERDVWLDGRAYFVVQADSSNPFIVRTRAGEALVLGTRFEIRVSNDDLRLAVVEGRVALSAGGERAEVRADEVSHVRQGQAPSVVRVADVRELLDLPDGLLVFQSTPLRKVAKELEHRFAVRFEIRDSAVAERKVTGWFTDERLEDVLTAVCRVTNTRCALEGTRVVVSP